MREFLNQLNHSNYWKEANTSEDYAISISEGACLRDVLTSWGSLPDWYSFDLRNGGDTSLGFLNGQLGGRLSSGEGGICFYAILTY